MCLLLVSAFTCNLRAFIIREPLPPIMKTNDEFMRSGRPFLYRLPDPSMYEASQFSDLALDRWMYENNEDVFFWTV